jgi:hypothetical protein
MALSCGVLSRHGCVSPSLKNPHPMFPDDLHYQGNKGEGRVRQVFDANVR